MPRISDFSVVLSVATSLIALLGPSTARASLLCPPFAELVNGQCNDAAGFSGAALASQALSSLSQTSTQQGGETALRKLKERREQEESRCAEGFSRIDGVCQRNPEPAPTVSAPAPSLSSRPEVAEAPTPARRKARGSARPSTEAREEKRRETKEKVASGKRPIAKRTPAPRLEPIEPALGAPGPRITKGPLLFGPPIPIEADARYGSWFQGYGDYERRTASGGAYVNLGPGFAAPVVPLQISVESRTTSFGFQAGADLTTRGVFTPGDGLITGAMAGFTRSDLTLRTRSLSTDLSLVDNGGSRTDASFTGGMVGLYATYFKDAFSADFIVKTDIFALSESFTDFIAFTPNSNGDGGIFRTPYNPRIFVWSTYDPIPVVDVNLVGDLNYRFNLYPNFWIEPTVGAQYVTTMYNGKAERIGLANGSQVMVQGGARFGYNFLLADRLPSTLTLTGLAYDDVLVSGGFVKTQAFQGNNLLAQADQGQVRGRGVVALNVNHGGGVSSFVQGEVRGGTGLIGAGGKVGVRYQW